MNILTAIGRLVVLAALFFGVGCERSPTVWTAEKSHARMVETLTEIADNADEKDTYFGTGQKRGFEAQLAALTEQSTTVERFVALTGLAVEELELGLERDSIRHFTEALEIADANYPEFEPMDDLLFFLAAAHLRLAETENCCATPNPDSCIFPLKGDALHDKREGAENAKKYLERLVHSPTLAPESQSEVLWLGHIATMTLGESIPGVVPLSRLETTDPSFPRFRNIAQQAGVDTFSTAGGVVAEDFDRDGWIDLVVSSWDPNGEMNFFRNRGNGTFEDQTKHANLAGIRGGLNLKPADFDNDGDVDVLVLRGAWLLEVDGEFPNSLLRNEGVDENGFTRFVDVTYAAGLAEPAHPTQVADWADFDLDGDLDLFVGNETLETDTQHPCQLFRNDGPGADGLVRFTDIAAAAGVESLRYVKGVSWGDYDGDRYPDLLLSCLHGENQLFRNLGDGTFEDVAAAVGITDPPDSFPCWFWDFNNDGVLDVFVSNYIYGAWDFLTYFQGQPIPDDSLPGLYAGDGSGGFREVAREAGLDGPMMPMGSNFGDLTNNGFPDVYLGTGKPHFSAIVPNLAFVNEGGKFVDRTVESGLGHLQKGHAVSFVDFDRDGDLDVFEQLGGAFPGDAYFDALFENPGFGRHWLSVRLRGVESNSFGVGCRIMAEIEEPAPFGVTIKRRVFSWLNSGGSFGANPFEAHLGLGTATVVKRLEVFWPKTGKTDVLTDVPVDQHILIHEGSNAWEAREIKRGQ